MAQNSQICRRVRTCRRANKTRATGHAVLSARSIVCRSLHGSGPMTLRRVRILGDRKYASRPRTRPVMRYCMVVCPGGTLRKRYVSRGICELTADGFLTDIRERTHIEDSPKVFATQKTASNWVALPPESIVSLNMWGFTASPYGRAGGTVRRLPAGQFRRISRKPSISCLMWWAIW